MDDAGTTAEQDARFGAMLRRLREDREFTQAEVVQRMRRYGIGYMNASTLSRVENGSRSVRLTEALAFARVFRVSLEAMVEDLEWLTLAESRHRRARERFVKFRESVVDVTEAQLDLAQLRDALTVDMEGRELSKETQAIASDLRQNMDDYIQIDLAKEAADLVVSRRESWASNRASRAGRFLNARGK